ncbi:putative CRISPR-associated helicase Cas3 [Sulfurisphaera tokodaii str. 7]|uniref:CRISPR-associated helicase Cas3 n=1 Tax=Sulfurisphaera tokodaii (strain DSM 16993 / JCM 10545 / NBRC 100140 / 7) TaxID=273063 RepID=F9VMI0_SULTO|nr:CRISPR-associated helicase Cas3' [Sulfurisphaera tokodaii]BAK54126.1 putative CRISPR-associated helicase Cas3 [Sulfurisphaera tokodaii str. 7]
MREGIRKVLELMDCKDVGENVKGKKLAECNDVNFILNFPTGYGKTTLSITLGEWLTTYTTTNFYRLIHVVPTRALVEDISKRAEGLKYAVQYSFAPSELKSPNFLADFIITTYDSFFLNLYKASIGEPFSDHGHYDLPRFSIYTSLVHFDEFHLMNESNSWTSLIGAVEHLSKLGVNFIMSSATPSKSVEEKIIDHSKNVIKVSVVNEYGNAINGRKCTEVDNGIYECETTKGRKRYKVVEIKEKIDVPNIDVKIVNNIEQFYNIVKDSEKAIIVVNTVDKAILLYDKLKHLKPCLIHSRFKISDRQKRKLDDCKLIVSTQVIEVGVNISSEIMITEQAPLTSIVQRVGRLLRYNEKNEGTLYIWKSNETYPYDENEVIKTVEALSNNDICLKHPYGCHNKKGYAEIIDSIISEPNINQKLLNDLEKISINPFLSKKDLDIILEKYCTLTNSFIVNLAIDKPSRMEDLIPFNGKMIDNAPLIRKDNKIVAYFEKYTPTNVIDKVEVIEDYIEFKDWKDLCIKYRKIFMKGEEKMILLALKADSSYYDSERGLRLK